jgi:hypothetical protein
MATPPRTGPGRLLARIIVFAAGLVLLIVVSAAAHVPGLPVVTVLTLLATTAGIAHAGSVLLRDTDGDGDAGDERASAMVPRDRRVVGAAAAGFAVTAALAITLAHGDATATAMTPATATTATRTVRAFLTDAVVLNDAYDACQYLSTPARQQVTNVAGEGRTCREAFTASRPGFDGIDTDSGVHGLEMRTTLEHGIARVTAVSPSGSPASTFVLRPATPADADSYRPPACAWRIVQGATAVLGRPAARAA